MIPGDALSGSRGKRLGVGGFLTVLCGLLGLALVVGGVASGLHQRTDWAPMGMGCALLSCSWGFGRITLAAWTEKDEQPTEIGGFLPWAATMAFVILGLAAAYHSTPR